MADKARTNSCAKLTGMKFPSFTCETCDIQMRNEPTSDKLFLPIGQGCSFLQVSEIFFYPKLAISARL